MGSIALAKLHSARGWAVRAFHHFRMGQPIRRAVRRNLGSGLTTRGCPTADSIGRSVNESE